MNPQCEAGAREFLKNNKWPNGLQDEYIKGATHTATTFFIIDDSGSMTINDSTRYLKNGNVLVKTNCNRWTELVDMMTFHASLANSAKEPTTFRLLNNAPPITIGGPADDGTNYRTFIQTLQIPPSGGTPLVSHINAIVAELTAMEGTLKEQRKKCKLIICSDGEASDGDVTVAMRPLKDLPVHIVIRMCTSDARVIAYWNKVEADLELRLDVVDTLSIESDSVAKMNPWLCYSEPLHRLRETGCNVTELDKLDEEKLSADQIRNVCILIFGEKYKDFLPHPEVDWKGFMTAIKNADEAEEHSYSPVAKSISFHIDKKLLAKHLDKAECAVM